MREKKHVMHERENIDKYVEDKEYIANTYVMRCFFISMIVYLMALGQKCLGAFLMVK